MSNPWFRMYSEVLNDPKVQKLPAELFKIWVNTLCLACNGNGTLPNLEDVSFALRLPFHETKSAFHELEKAGLLVTDGETFHVRNWDKRQYKSDVSTDRVKKFRKRIRNVSETPSEQIQNRTDTDKKEKLKKRKVQHGYSDQFETFWKLYPPNTASKTETWKSYQRAQTEGAEHEKIIHGVGEYLRWLDGGSATAAQATTWLNQKRWEVDYAKAPKIHVGGFRKPEPVAPPKRKNALIGTPEAEAEYAV